MAESAETTRVPLTYARKFGVFCRAQNEQIQLVYRTDADPSSIAEVRRVIGNHGKLCLLDMDHSRFAEALNETYQQNSDEALQMVQGLGDSMDLDSLASALPQAEDLLSREDDAPIIRLINAVLSQAVQQNASDVHIETYEKSLAIRFRIDGVLRNAVQPRRELAPLLVSRIKVMAKMDIAEKRIPQDGRISVLIGGKEVDVRVSTLPSNYGERVVLRLLDKTSSRFDLGSLNMDSAESARLHELIKQPHGIFLVTGPTGSGKSTTLYAALTELNDRSRNILTIEDPIEYNLEGIGQSQVNTKADMTFARGLRAMLRQDPDIVMVGEIRDRETAEIAVQASLTGHMVMSTLHTNSAIGAITRLKDMGIEPFLLSSSLTGVLAQRLVRTLCSSCAGSREADEYEIEFLGLQAGQKTIIGQAAGCSECEHSGYSGRTGLYELLVIDQTMRRLIHGDAGEAELAKAAASSTVSMRSNSQAKVLARETTIEEVLRVLQSV